MVWKTAASLDGKTAAADGTSRWITSPDARADAHRLRAWADAIVVGSRTALADDPALTVRDAAGLERARPPLRVLVDSAGRVPVGGALADDDGADPRRDHGAHARRAASTDGSPSAPTSRCCPPTPTASSLPSLLDDLGKRDVQGLLVEGGATLAWSFVREDLVDRVVAYIAPTLVGGAAAPGCSRAAGSRRSPARAACRSRTSRPWAPTFGWRPMFTGIVEERGAVRSLEGSRLTVACDLVTEDSPVGASVAVSGTCLTVVARGRDHLGFDLSEETLARTALGRRPSRGRRQPRAAGHAGRPARRPPRAGARGRAG